MKSLGQKKPKYSNEAWVDKGLFRDQVKLFLPQVEDARCSVQTKICGLPLGTARAAEESAAAKALSFLESNFKINIVDKDYDDRVYATKQHIFIARVLSKFLDVLIRIKKDLKGMQNNIHSGVDMFCGCAKNAGVTRSNAEVAAMEFCAYGVSKVHVECRRSYEVVAQKINQLQKYREALAELEEQWWNQENCAAMRTSLVAHVYLVVALQ